MTADHIVTVVIETPKASKNRYQYNEHQGHFYLHQQLPKGLNFPYDFGYITNTADDNGKPLNAIVTCEGGTFTGCRLQCIVIGCIQYEIIDKKGIGSPKSYYLAIPICDGTQPIKNLKDLCPGTLENIKSFLTNYHFAQGATISFNKDINAIQAVKNVNKAKVDDDVSIRLELLLPHSDSKGNKFPEKLFEEVNEELLANFGGITVHSRQPAEGFWKPSDRTVQQPVLVYELMLLDFDLAYWKKMKAKLEKKFKQTEVMITYGPSKKVN